MPIYLDLDAIEKDVPLELIPLGTMITIDLDSDNFTYRNIPSLTVKSNKPIYGTRMYTVIDHIHSNITKNTSIFHWYELLLWDTTEPKTLKYKEQYTGLVHTYHSHRPPEMITLTHNQLKGMI